MSKILLVVRWPVGGIRTFINYVYSNWSDPDLELHIYTVKCQEVEALKIQMKNVNCIWHDIEEESSSFPRFTFGLLGVIQKNGFKIVHAHGFTSALAASIVSPLLKSAMVFTSHDVLNKNQFLGFKGWLKRKLISFSLNRFSAIHSVSCDAELNLQENLPDINVDKCIVIHNGVDTNRYYMAEAADLRSTFDISANATVIGFFGRFMSQKGFKYLIDAIESLDHQFPGKFQVVCFGSGSYIREEQAEICKRNLELLFHFHSFVSDTAPYIKGCDIVVMPSLWEACPLVPMEVMAAGVPLVATTCVGLREVCKESPAIMIEPGSSQSLHDGILVASRSDRSKFSDYASEARDRYDVQKAIAEINALYQKVLK